MHACMSVCVYISVLKDLVETAVSMLNSGGFFYLNALKPTFIGCISPVTNLHASQSWLERFTERSSGLRRGLAVYGEV